MYFFLLNQTKSLLATTLYMILIIVTIVYFNYNFVLNCIYDRQSYFKENKVLKLKIKNNLEKP